MSRIYVVGTGPGSIDEMTQRARTAIEESDIVIGYAKYVELVRRYFPQKKFISSAMTREVARCEAALEEAEKGLNVALVSSGDSGIYGMAGVMLEVAQKSGTGIPVEVIPGVTSASAAAAVLGAPLMHDFAVISLSDLMTPWELIRKRLELAAQGDFVLCIYNPKSRKRITHIETAREIVLGCRKGSTPVGIVRNAGRPDQEWVITDLEGMLDHEIDMFTTVVIGNSQTYVRDGRMITPRGYVLT